jgi:hypothetical protein
MKLLTPILCSLLIACSDSAMPTSAAAFDHSHAELDAAMKAYVVKGMVDYAGLLKNRAGLDSYIAKTSAVSESEFNGWSQEQQLAFLINIYNAETVQLILDNWPVKSIKDIGNFISTAQDKKVVKLFGKTTTLNYVEHDLLRAKYSEPRIHFAIVCAAISCPELRAEAFTPDKLEAQLADQAKQFLGDKSKNEYKDGELQLSKIFDWFEEDFTKGGKTLADYVNPWFDADVSKADVGFKDYDWDLNKQ